VEKGQQGGNLQKAEWKSSFWRPPWWRL